MKFRELAVRSLRTIRVVGRGVPEQANDIQVAFEASQDMFDSFANDQLTIFQTLPTEITAVANKGSTSNPYTVGSGGDINIPRPLSIPQAAARLLTTTPFYDRPLSVLLPDDYQQIPIKNLSSALPTALYFDNKFNQTGASVGLGNLYLYPVPDGSIPMKLVLWIPVPMTGFADINVTDYEFPPGVREALRYMLAKRLAPEFGKSLSPEVQSLIRESERFFERPNMKSPRLKTDFGIPSAGRAGLYDWRLGVNVPYVR